MINDNPVRVPQQKRSIEKKERIVKAAYTLICDKGYYKMTTPEIAAKAGVSTGCLYSYFKDKHDILLDVLKWYQDQFDELRDNHSIDIEAFASPEQWIREFMEKLIAIHDDSVAFQREMKMLCYSDPDVAAQHDAQTERIQNASLKYIKMFIDQLNIDDLEAAAIVSSLIIGGVTDQISLCKNTIDRERILNEGVKAICRYLKG